MKSHHKLVPINEDNVDLVLKWRNQESVRSNLFESAIITIEDHLKWFKALQSSKDRVGFVFEYKGTPVGVVQGHERESHPKKWIWGCYLGNPGTIPKMGTRMGLCAMEYFFESENCEIMIGEMIKANTVSHKFNLAIGFHVEKDIQITCKDGRKIDSVLLVQTKSEWLKNKNGFFEKYFG